MPPGLRRLRSSSVELYGEEHQGRALFQRIGHVDDGDVEAAGGLLQVGVGVGMDEFEAGVVEGPPVEVGQVLPAQLDHLAVEVHHHRAPDRVVRQRLSGRRALAAAGDEHVARVGVRQHGRMRQRLVVDELVHRRGLCLVVQNEAAAETSRVLNRDVLVCRPALVQHVDHPLGLHQVGRDGLVVPRAFSEALLDAHRGTSTGDATRRWMKPRLTSFRVGLAHSSLSISSTAAL